MSIQRALKRIKLGFCDILSIPVVLRIGFSQTFIGVYIPLVSPSPVLRLCLNLPMLEWTTPQRNIGNRCGASGVSTTDCRQSLLLADWTTDGATACTGGSATASVVSYALCVRYLDPWN